MITQNRGTIAFAVCGSFCTLEAALQSARALTAQGWQLLPVMSFAARQDTRFGTGNYWKEQLEAAAGHPVLDTLQAVEPLGPRKMAQALVVAPCTGATLSRLAAGGAGRVHQRRAGGFRREHRPAVPAQALLFCALRAG